MRELKRSVFFLSQRREEPHNTEVQVAQTTHEMVKEMERYGFWVWSKAQILDIDFQILLLDKEPIPFILDREASLELIRQAMQRAKELGATDIGLGSLVASVARGGEDLLVAADDLELRLDHGDDMSTALAVKIVWQLRDEFGFDLANATVGIVGAVGVMGAGFARLLVNDVKKFVLVVRKIDKRAEELRDSLIAEASARGQCLVVDLATDFRELAEKNCQFVYVAHSDPRSRLRPEHLAPGTIVLDACIPPAVIPLDFVGRDTLILPVGCGVLPRAIAPQGIGVNLGLGETEDGPVIYGCMIGCALAAYRGETHHRIGAVDPNYARLLLAEAAVQKIVPQPFLVSEKEVRHFIARY